MEAFRVTVQWFYENGGKELSQLHLDEARALTAGPEAEIDWGGYEALEQSGHFLCLAVIEEGRMLGYVAGTAQPSIHNSGKWDFCTSAFYTVKEHRKSGISKVLFDALCQMCRESGINDINYSVSERAPHSAHFVKAMGMHKAETMYSINLGDSHE